jgi:hypothetical protein
MAGLIGLIRKGHFKPDENVVFVHTGGSAALFGYMHAFQTQLPNEIDTRNMLKIAAHRQGRKHEAKSSWTRHFCWYGWHCRSIAVEEARHLKPRWPESRNFWKGLLEAAIGTDDRALANVHLHCLQLLGSDVVLS